MSLLNEQTTHEHENISLESERENDEKQKRKEDTSGRRGILATGVGSVLIPTI